MVHTVQDKLTEYQDIYEQLYHKLRWKVSDKRTLMAISLMYVVNGKPFHFPHFFELSEELKRQAGLFSPLKSHSRFAMAAMLDVRFERSAVADLFELYRAFVAGGFSRGAFTYIAAAAMLSNRTSYDEEIRKSLTIYKKMREKHVFLTSSSDYPLAALLAKKEGSVEEIVQLMEELYHGLSELGFSKGNDLQFLSHILSLQQDINRDSLLVRCAALQHAFREAGQRVKKMHYASIGLLALLESSPASIVHEVTEAVSRLNTQKQFKSYKDINFMMAVNIVVSNKISNPRLLETGLYTAIEAIIQAQQAAMVACVAVASSASASGGNGS